MAIRKILRFPNPALRQQTVEVSGVDDRIRALVEDMCETMYASDGAGLAAIQIGAPERIFVVDSQVAGGEKNQPPVVFINPVIEWTSPEQETKDEGCLSFPGIFIPVKRPLRARVRALSLDGTPFTAEGEGLYARALLHENDHLIGRLLYDLAGPLKRQIIKRKLERMTDEEAAALASEHTG